jgi:deoxyribonucleoside regulator
VATEIARQGLGSVSLLSAPAIVHKAATRLALEADPSVGNILRVARASDVLLYSTGELSTESVLVDAGYVDPAAVEWLRGRGAVGDILGRFINSAGDEVDDDLRDRTIALTLDEIRRVPCVIAVASGRAKAGIARSAAANGLCTVLITDSDVAAELLT